MLVGVKKSQYIPSFARTLSHAHKLCALNTGGQAPAAGRTPSVWRRGQAAAAAVELL